MTTPRLHTSVLLTLFVGSTLILAACGPARGTETPPSETPTAETPATSMPHVQAADPVDAGRYLITIGGCNDCHTAGYLEVDGNLPESEWLTGVPIGFRGPWGTSYASNLRLVVQDMPEEAFVQMARTRKALPPMPWPSLNRMSDDDLRAIYRFIHSLGAKGEPMPRPVGPDQEPATPYFDFEPQHMERLQAPAPEAAPATGD